MRVQTWEVAHPQWKVFVNTDFAGVFYIYLLFLFYGYYNWMNFPYSKCILTIYLRVAIFENGGTFVWTFKSEFSLWVVKSFYI